jgi:hypothetical protein
MSRFTHVLLTRFNARFAAKWTDICLDEDWLKHRFALFEEFCYPSVVGQTSHNFSWIVFFHSDTPDVYKHRIEKLSKGSVLRPVYNEFLSRECILEAVRSVSNPGADYLITTTIDNDDAICRNFVQETQLRFTGQEFQYVNWEIGYVYCKGKFYFRRDPQSPFNSLISLAKDNRLVYDVWHNKIRSTGTVVQIRNNPGWIQVVHGKNVSNRIRGYRISRPEISKYFSIEIGTAGNDEKRSEIVLDRMVLFPLRILRDVAVRFIKRIINLQNIAFFLRYGRR